MKRLALLALSCLLLAINLIAGDIYQKATIKLIPDDTFAQGVDWSKLFIANLPTPPKPYMETRESMALAPDNTIYVVEHNNLDIGKLFIFGPGGALQGTEPDASEKVKSSIWSKTPYSAFVTDKNELWINEWRGIARCDRQGRVLAITKVDHAVSDFLFLKNGALIISGWVVTTRRSDPIKLSISLLNTQTAKETVITSSYQKPFAISFTLLPEKDQGKEGGLLMMGTPAKAGKMFIAGTPEGTLVAGNSESPEILIFSPEGRKIGGFTLPIQRPILNPELKMQSVQSVSKNIDSLAGSGRVPPDEIERARGMLKDYPTALPYYSNLLIDDQGNILVFLTNPDKSSNVEIMALSHFGKALGTCRLALPQGVSLRLDRPKQMIIRDGWFYALIRKNVSGKEQVQLARFKLE